MDSDKAIGGLYLDADDFHRGFFCHLLSCLSGKREEKTPSCFPLTDSQSRQLSVWIRDGLTALLLPSNKFSIKAPGKSKIEGNTEKRTNLL